MSRIENAMEKAALLRLGLEETTPTEPEPARDKAPQHATSMPVPAKRLAPRHPFLVGAHAPHSAIVEEYRKLKSSLVKLTKGEEFRNTILVTSAVPGEGKTLTSLNLAMSLAQEMDHTVLLIDADLRRPSLSRYLDLEHGPGLADVLLGEAEIAETLVPTGIGKLSVMRAGRQVESPAELFSSLRMQELLVEMKHRYPDRYLIFDTPPVLPFAETRSLSHLVDGVLLVVMERLTTNGDVQEALESLKGSPLLGLVYNAAAVAGGDRCYSYYRGYQGAAVAGEGASIECGAPAGS